MAKIIEVEFTDAQWELILEHFPKSIGGFNAYEGWTEALLAEAYQRRIANEVVDQMRYQMLTTTEFDEILE